MTNSRVQPSFVLRLLIGLAGIAASSLATAQSSDLKHPDWHPDGRLLVSEGSCTDGTGLYLIDTTTGNISLIFNSEHSEGYPRWFSDGERIAFHQIDVRRKARIHIADVSTTGQFSGLQTVSDGPFDIEPAPSPDGLQLIFSARGNKGQDIVLLDLKSNDRKVWETDFAENFPSWHPDGESIIFHARKSGDTHIYERRLSTWQIFDITRKGSPNLVGHLSGDAARLVFSSERDGDREIYVKSLDSGREQRITNRPGRDGYPKFSPDQRRIAYHSDVEGADTTIHVLDLDSGEQNSFSCEDFPG